MSELIIQSIIVGAVALFSALIGGMLPNLVQQKSDMKIRKIEKLEELFINVENWYNTQFNIFCIEFKLVIEGHIDWNTYLDRVISIEPKGDHIKSEIRLYLYFPKIESEYNALRNSVYALSDYLNNEMKSIYLSGKELINNKNEYDKLTLSTIKAFQTFKKSMNRYAKEISK